MATLPSAPRACPRYSGHCAPWLLDTSVFHQMAPAPAESHGWVSAGITIAVGASAVALGSAAVRRRDLAGE
jgi:hypothetical protein